ncbi:hypothetical protein POX_b02670 [Penicillium oxalicum]|uniref:Uncharacterized protein n=1 Tax=Penicillium oxalicum (strain 114-2 / CGMCC 5302) TaxID=933388 RepID=S7ZJ70_PENO1|nr:hypothetical protein POX_b02670 [Penicillium oxalicum]EPS30319.1 hypothetical protein PDE_05270 [Penicillium oxalicum 114-2]KAI2792630.1 hypothetical protein POX_b02670 [Penicillium oxalicum]
MLRLPRYLPSQNPKVNIQKVQYARGVQSRKRQYIARNSSTPKEQINMNTDEKNPLTVAATTESRDRGVI